MEVLSVIVTYPKVPLVDKLKLTNIVWVWPGKRISDMVQSTRKKSRAVSASVESRTLPFPTQQSGFLLMTNIITCAHWASQICVCMRLFLHSSFVASFWDKFESFPLTTKAPPRTFVFPPWPELALIMVFFIYRVYSDDTIWEWNALWLVISVLLYRIYETKETTLITGLFRMSTFYLFSLIFLLRNRGFILSCAIYWFPPSFCNIYSTYFYKKKILLKWMFCELLTGLCVFVCVTRYVRLHTFTPM